MRTEWIIIDECWEGIIFTIISSVITGGAGQIKKHRFKKGTQVVVYSLLTMYVTLTCIREGKKVKITERENAELSVCAQKMY